MELVIELATMTIQTVAIFIVPILILRNVDSGYAFNCFKTSETFPNFTSGLLETLNQSQK